MATDDVVVCRLRMAAGEHWGLEPQKKAGGDEICTYATSTTPYPIRIKEIQMIKKSSPVGKSIDIILVAPRLASIPKCTRPAAIESDISKICLKAVFVSQSHLLLHQSHLQYLSHIHGDSPEVCAVPGDVKPTTFSSPNSSAPSVTS